MASFAQLDENNVVIWVIGISNDAIMDENGNESEEKGIQICKGFMGSDTRWVQTSLSGKFRRQYASIGGLYDPVNDVFIDPRPLGMESFIIVDGKWIPPIPYPEPYTAENWPLSDRPFTEHHAFLWNEENVSWDLFAPREQPEPE